METHPIDGGNPTDEGNAALRNVGEGNSKSLGGKLSQWYEFSQVTGHCSLKQLEVFSA